MSWRFKILDRNNVATVIEEPVGWDANTSEIKRDPDAHGIFFTNSAQTMEFYGEAMRMLKEEKDLYRSQGDMTFVAEEKCLAEEDFVEFMRGKFVFLKYEFYCGSNGCYVKIPIENTNEVMQLRNLINQKVNIEAVKAFDEITDLVPYDKLPFTLSLPSKTIKLQDKAEWQAEAKTSVDLSEVPDIEYDTAPSNFNFGWFQVVPQIEITKLSEFGIFATASQPEINFICSGFYNDDKCPDLFKVRVGDSGGVTDRTLYFDWSSCTAALYNDANKDNFAFVSRFNLNLQYTLQFDTKTARIIFLNRVVVIRRKDGTYEMLSNVQEVSATFNAGSPGGYVTGTYWAPDSTHTISENFTLDDITLNDGDYLFVFVAGLSEYVNTQATAGLAAFDVTGKAGNIEMVALSQSQPTDSKVFAINEVISRITESITNNKLRAYSEYFGRTDSQPYSVAADGCGSLEVVTDGIRIRRQENKTPGQTSVFSLSLQDVFNGVNPIHNIGYGIEPDTNRTGFNRLRMEPWKFFYNDEVIMSCTNIDNISRKVYDKEIFSTFQFGYSKWEAEEYNGLDEFLTKRNYRTSLNTVKNDLLKLTEWVGSGYTWEITRRKGNEDSKDWRYDKNTFIVCCKRDGENNLIVELGNITSPENIIDPPTIYNFRISPLRNAMRWMNKVLASYVNFDSDAKIIFTDGDGNYFAKGQMTSTDDCKLENGVLIENQTLSPVNFSDQEEAKPFLLPERVAYEYPMSSKDYKNIEANPNGLIYFENDCEEGYGWIDTIQFKPEAGTASFNLIPKNSQ